MAKSCCPDNAHGFLVEDPSYQPLGKAIEFEGVNAYVVGSGSTCIVFIHDIFGLDSGMNKLICDSLSAKLNGVTIIAPDFYPEGNLLREDELAFRGASQLMWKFIWLFFTCRVCAFPSFIRKTNWENSSAEIFNKVTSHLISDYGCAKFIPLGFCWGSYIGFKACNSALHKEQIVGNFRFNL